MKLQYSLAAFMSSVLLVSASGARPDLGGVHIAYTPVSTDKIAGGVRAAFAAGQLPDVLLHLEGPPDVSAARVLPSKKAKTEYVVTALRARAHVTQSTILAHLRAAGVQHESLWLINAIAIKQASVPLLEALALRDEVARIDIDAPAALSPAADVGSGPTVIEEAPLMRSAGAVEGGVARVKAPEAWARGYTGQGIVIANLDTGTKWDHEAVMPSYRGWNAATGSVDHNYSWFDPYTKTITSPSDDQGHGTHTTGTHSGVNGIGVAPGSRWMSCRNMNSGFGSVSSYIVCLQFALAPTDVNGSNPRLDLAADITNNSWGCDYEYMGGEPGCQVPSALITATQTLRDAGVMIVASNGNDGALGCASTRFAPATLDQSFTVGATDSRNMIAAFSSRGPSAYSGSMRPHISAPGVAVRSSTRSGISSYGISSGTSMAGPHVAGVVALLWSAAPWLRGHINETEHVLMNTATPLTTTTENCGGVSGAQSPNNTYGYGLINAEAAISMALSAPLLAVTPVSVTRAQKNTPFTLTVVARNVFSVTSLSNVFITISLPAPLVFVDGSNTPIGSKRILSRAELGARAQAGFALQVMAPITGSFMAEIGAVSRVNGAPLVANPLLSRIDIIDVLPTSTPTPTATQQAPTPTPTPAPPSAVQLAFFTVETQGRIRVVRWSLLDDDFRSLNVLRGVQPDGSDALPINKNSIYSSHAGSYEYHDTTALPGVRYYYWLEDVTDRAAVRIISRTLSSPASVIYLPLATR